MNVPMDHGITLGAVDGLRDIESTIDAVGLASPTPTRFSENWKE
jgi:DhnA family fructose-bisphosphate aldolase class Ia